MATGAHYIPTSSEFGSSPIIVPQARLTEEEFVDWCGEDVRAEWVDGEVIVMSPVSSKHALITKFLIRLIDEFAERKKIGRVYSPDMQVRLPQIKRRRVPDAVFVSSGRETIVQERHIDGAPDLIVEVVSPDSTARDWREKYLEFESAGVLEYWVIDPLHQQAEFYSLGADGKFQRIAVVEEKLHSRVLAGLFVRPDWFWQTHQPPIADVLREIGVG